MDHPLVQQQFSELSRLEYRLFLTKARQASYADILLARFIGEYRFGSAGDSDARFMVAMLKAAVWAWEPEACIIDLSELRYEWGDMMDHVLGFADDVLQVQPVTVVGPHCSEAVGTLLHGPGGSVDFQTHAFVYRSVEEAFAAVEARLLDASRAT